MSFGAMLTYPDGTPFYIDGSLPLVFLGKQTASHSGGGSSQSSIRLIASDYGFPTFCFCVMTQTGGASRGYFRKDNDPNIVVFGNGEVNLSFNIEIYNFGLRNQAPTKPSYGMLVNDANGNIVIHNETKVIRSIGSIGGMSKSTDTTLNGKYAFSPMNMGLMQGVLQPGGGNPPIPWVDQFWSSAYYNGQTRLTAQVSSINPGGSVQSQWDAQAPIYYINCADYD